MMAAPIVGENSIFIRLTWRSFHSGGRASSRICFSVARRAAASCSAACRRRSSFLRLVKSHGRIVSGGPANGQVAAQSGHHIGTNPMDDRVEAFLADVLVLEGEELDAIRAGVRVALGEAETIFRAREDNRRMKDKAAHACAALCRARVVEEFKRRKATTTAEHLRLVLSITDKLGKFLLQGQ
jgi:hypothetical protein